MIARIILGVIGAALIVYVLAADPQQVVGFERGSVGQVVMIALGLAIIGVAVFNKRIRPKSVVDAYTQLAVILLNTLVMFLVVELIIILVFNSAFVTQDVAFVPEAQELDLYTEADSEWREAYGQEWAEVQGHLQYSAYDLWRRRPYEGEAINIQADGRRLTPGSNCTDDSYRVYLFGGSTMWGLGVTDAMTIPAHLQNLVNAEAVCIVNHAELAYVNTQSVVTLMKLLQRGDVPDMVVFYDGVNDVIASYQRDAPGLHRQWSLLANLVQGTTSASSTHPLIQWMQQSFTFRYVDGLLQESAPVEETDQAEIPVEMSEAPLSRQTADTYIENYQMVTALGEAYGFSTHFFWQPVLIVEDKPIAGQEDALAQAPPDDLRNLFRDTYAAIKTDADTFDNLHYIADIFNDVDEMLYIDYNHVSTRGNQLVAEAIYDAINSEINNNEREE